MAIAIQHKRGVLANRPSLLAGELYCATDTNQVSLGPTPVLLGSPIVAAINLTGQTAAKTATLLFTPSVTGFFRIHCALKVTTAATTSCTLGGSTGVVITYTDGDGSVAMSQTMALQTTAGAVAINSSTNTTANQLNGTMVVFAKTGVAINYAIGYTSSGATVMQYSAHLRCEAM